MRPRTTILIAAVIYFVVAAWMPLGHYILYPLTLFTTWVHEMGHGLTALIMGGSFESLEIDWNGGGLAWSFAAHGWPDALVAAGGLLAPPLLGAIILGVVHGPRRARVLLGVVAGAILLSLAIWVRTAAGFVTMPIVAALLGWAVTLGFGAKPERRVLLAQLLGVILALDTLTRMVSYAFMDKTSDGKTSDVSHIASNLGGSYVLWGFVITILALGMLALGLWLAWRRPATRASA
jgi:hypothetical protein